MGKTRHPSGKFSAKPDLTDDLFFDSGLRGEPHQSDALADEPLDPGDFETSSASSLDRRPSSPPRPSTSGIDPPTVRIDLEGPAHPDIDLNDGLSAAVTHPDFDPRARPVGGNAAPTAEPAYPESWGPVFRRDALEDPLTLANAGRSDPVQALAEADPPLAAHPEVGLPPLFDLTVADVLESPESWTVASPAPAPAPDPVAEGGPGTPSPASTSSNSVGLLPLGSRPALAVEAASAMPESEVRLPCALLIVHEEPAAGARRAAGLMTFGYTCRVVTERDAPRALAEQSFDAVVLDIPSSHSAGMALGDRLSILSGFEGPAVLTAPVLLEGSVVAYSQLVTPTTDHELARAIEAVRSPSGAASELPRGDLDLDVHVIRALVFAGDPGPRRGRVRSISLSGGVLVQIRGVLPIDSVVDVEFTHREGHRADFVGRVQSVGDEQMRIQLELGASDERFLNKFLSQARDPLEGGLEPVRIRSRAERLLEAGILSDRQLARRFAEVSTNLDDNVAHQAFIQACLKAQRLEFAVRCYRDLKKEQPTDERIDRYLNQVGTILGFYAFRKDSGMEAGPALPSSVRWTLGLFILAVVVLWVLATTLS